MSYSQHLASGALSGFASAICLQPFDLLKTRIQQGDGTPYQHRALGRSFHVARNVIARDGILGLWRGTLPTLARNIPGVAMYMSTLHQIRAAMAKTTYFPSRATNTKSSSVLPTLTIQGNLVAGAVARTAVGTLLNPLAILKARYESDLHSYRSFTSAAGSLLRSGPSQLFRGAAASAMRDAPYAGLFLVAYEHLKRDTAALLMQPGSNSSSALIHAIAGAGAGTAATLATHPFDVLKTKLQVRNDAKYNTLRSTIRTIWTSRGVSGFFDGVSLRLSRKILSSAIGWAVYEGVLIFIHQQS
ncbi:hypothetical protein M422DRAFT_234124 [Sphaerobolus stellatus SS14]|uniref:Mitochondrial glycine transporter n=1 Tax=Sphaerobolus stellatus (strain SS14) TaxID=990650 RepID=A0A0C9V4H5_SPHS4|nr:hypothetical protein M422DRAFT_234124 [Sphaerobolus stellatus SS14]